MLIKTKRIKVSEEEALIIEFLEPTNEVNFFIEDKYGYNGISLTYEQAHLIALKILKECV